MEANEVAPKPSPQLEKLFEDDTYQLTGVAISKGGRLFTNYPRWDGPHRYDVVEVLKYGSIRPYPDEAMNSWKEGEDGKNKWVCVQAVYVDAQDYLWVVDPACPKMEKVYRNSHKLVQFDLNTDRIVRTYFFEGVVSEKSYVNDIRIDRENNVAYLTNSNEGGIIVIDLESGKMRQLLQDHPSVQSDPDFSFVIDGKELKKKGEAVKIHSDGLALSPDQQWLYFKPLTDDKLYRIRTAFLRDETLAPAEVEQWVEDLGSFHTTDGMIFDATGRLLTGDLQRSSIVAIDKEHKATTLLQDDRLVWPDSYSVSEDGYLYLSCSHIHKGAAYNEGEDRRTAPYALFRLKL